MHSGCSQSVVKTIHKRLSRRSYQLHRGTHLLAQCQHKHRLASAVWSTAPSTAYEIQPQSCMPVCSAGSQVDNLTTPTHLKLCACSDAYMHQITARPATTANTQGVTCCCFGGCVCQTSTAALHSLLWQAEVQVYIHTHSTDITAAHSMSTHFLPSEGW